jgi:hypothetical protein
MNCFIIYDLSSPAVSNHLSNILSIGMNVTKAIFQDDEDKTKNCIMDVKVQTYTLSNGFPS